MNTKEEPKKDRLARMITQHPELPVIPMVFGDVVEVDSSSWWQASLGDSSICRYVLAKDLEGIEGMENLSEYMDEGTILWYDEREDIQEMLMDELDISEFEANRQLAGLPWKKAIRVYIDVQDDVEYMKLM
ncbi:MAG: hypothetical protein LUD50_04540 [Clostridia bacterium]|nr:hypothetical protein [Clostridia bacterium]